MQPSSSSSRTADAVGATGNENGVATVGLGDIDSEKFDVMVLVALETEFTALMAALQANFDMKMTQLERVPGLPVCWLFATANNDLRLLVTGKWDRQGQQIAQQITTGLLSTYSASTVVLLGVSGALKSNIFDCVVVDMADEYDVRNDTGDDKVKFSGRWHETTDRGLCRDIAGLHNSMPRFKKYLQQAMLLRQGLKVTKAGKKQLKANKVDVLKPSAPVVGYAASGAAVNKSPKLRQQLLAERSRHLLCQDTESVGFATAVAVARETKNFVGQVLVLRGISDTMETKDALHGATIGDDNELTKLFATAVKDTCSADVIDDQNQVLAAGNAALLLCALIDLKLVRGQGDFNPVSMYLKLSEKATQHKHRLSNFQALIQKQLRKQFDILAATSPDLDAVQVFDSAQQHALVLHRQVTEPTATPAQFKKAAENILNHATASAAKKNRYREIEDLASVQAGGGKLVTKFKLEFTTAKKAHRMRANVQQLGKEADAKSVLTEFYKLVDSNMGGLGWNVGQLLNDARVIVQRRARTDLKPAKASKAAATRGKATGPLKRKTQGDSPDNSADLGSPAKKK